VIYLLHGSDSEKSRAKLRELIAGLLKKKPDASHLKITEETFNPAQLDELAGGLGLFESRVIVELDHVLAKEADTIIEHLPAFAESGNIFVFLEGELNKATLKKFEKSAEKIQEFAVKKSDEPAERRDFNIFSLTDAFGRRDRKQLWVLYNKAKMKDISDEEIHGIIFWQIKSMILASSSRSAAESGLKPFVYQKSLGFVRNFQAGELEKTSSRLVSLYHDARRGITDFSIALEQFILEV
jgi:DNA polymerase III delta subunit